MKKRTLNNRAGVVELDEASLAELETTPGIELSVIEPEIKRVLASDDYQPPLLPEVAISLTKIANKQNVSIQEVEKTVVRDPAVASRVVSMANSAFYSRGRPARDLKIAITRLGLATVRDIAFQVVAKTKIFRVPGYSDYVRELFDTALAAGMVTREICRVLNFEAEMAYLCGLLHDMGHAIILGILGDTWTKKGEKLEPIENLMPLIDSMHTIAGARVCNKWDLPPLIVDAIRHHHELDKADQVSQMAIVVAVGDILLSHAGIGKEREPIDPLSEPLFYRLNLTQNQVEKLLSFADSLADDPELLLSMG